MIGWETQNEGLLAGSLGDEKCGVHFHHPGSSSFSFFQNYVLFWYTRLNFYTNLIVTEKEFSCKYTILILITAFLMDQIKDQDSLRRKKD